jgi:uncharacterized protein YegJ (DUF2314 family)
MRAISYAHVYGEILLHGTISDLDGVPKSTWSYHLDGQDVTQEPEMSEKRFEYLWSALTTNRIFDRWRVSDPSQQLDPNLSHVIGIIWKEAGEQKSHMFMVPWDEDGPAFEEWLEALKAPVPDSAWDNCGDLHEAMSDAWARMNPLQWLRPDAPLLARKDDPEMKAAIAEAKRRWPEFLERWAKRTPDEQFSVKGVFRDGNEEELMWVHVSDIESGVIFGVLGNCPAYVTNVRQGNRVRLDLDDIIDFMHADGQKTFGGFTDAIVMRRLRERE